MAITSVMLNRVYFAVEHMTNLEGQDHTLVIEMSQAMINDLIETGELKPVIEYVKRYCDVADSETELEEIAACI